MRPWTVRSLARLVQATARAQVQVSRRNVEDLMPILTMPLLTLVSMAILVHSGFEDFASYSLVASLLMTLGQMGFFVGSEILALEREDQMLELIVASPAPYVIVLATRILVLVSTGLVGFGESWLIARLVFGVRVTAFHPVILTITAVATLFAATSTSLVTCALFALARNTRTCQSGINGPLYLLGGVLVPVTFLPTWLQPLCRWVFFYWAADLLRESLSPGTVEGVTIRVAAIVALGSLAGAIGSFLLRTMFDHLRREGTLGLL